jgi:uncharacterized Ntn-hydrolase superfamily protein
MSKALNDYFEALDRLKVNKPINIPKDSKINNDNVALEAGRKKGSIKKSRESFAILIEAINEASKTQNIKTDNRDSKIEKQKDKIEELTELYESSLNRELMLIEQLNELEKIANSRIASNNLMDN